MIPTKQTILHDPSNGLHGNCLSAVLASLLHLPIETVPVFSDPDHWLKDLNAWLRPYGLAYLSFPDTTFDLTLSNFGIKGLMHEIGGMSTRWKDVGHSCVAEDGQVVFDPHPSNDGLNAGVESSGIFVALEPWKWAHARENCSNKITRLEGEAKVLRILLGKCVDVIDTIPGESDDECRRLLRLKDTCIEAMKVTP
jgi:hypothetical protein